MARLRPCTTCHRHVRRNETRCPFCEAELDGSPDAGGPKIPGTPLTRAAIIFGAATAVAACTSGGPDVPGPSSSSGGSSSGNTSSSGAAPAYGVPEIDSGDPDTNDSGGPVALYGPAPVDGGG